jgi:hypothetical protein
VYNPYSFPLESFAEFFEVFNDVEVMCRATAFVAISLYHALLSVVVINKAEFFVCQLSAVLAASAIHLAGLAWFLTTVALCSDEGLQL